MDIEKLIEQLRYLADTPSYTAFHDAKEREIICDQCEADFCYDKQQDAHWCMYEALSRAATALSMLQAENEKLRAELEQVKEDWSTAANGLMLMQKKLNKVYRMLYDPLIIVDGGHLRPVKNTSRQQVYKKLVDLQVEMGINRGFPWGEMRMEKKED